MPIVTGAAFSVTPLLVYSGQATIGRVSGDTSGIEWDRPELNKSETTVRVPQDEPTVQDALRKVPRRLAANYIICIDPSDGPYDEHIVTPPVQSEDLLNSTEGANSNLQIEGLDSGTRWQTASVFVIGGWGAISIKLRDCNVSETTTYGDENAAYIAYGSGSVTLSNCGIVGSARGSGSVGVSSYASLVKLETVFDWGADLVQNGTETKHNGSLMCDGGLTATGSVTQHGHVAKAGPIHHAGRGPDAGDKSPSTPEQTEQLPLTLSIWGFLTGLKSERLTNQMDPSELKQPTAFGPTS